MTNMKKKWDDTINVISTLASVGNLGSNHIPQEYHLDDVTPTFLQEMVQACEQVEISRSISKTVHPVSENVDLAVKIDPNVDLAANIDTVIATIPFLQPVSIENKDQQSDPLDKDDTNQTPAFPIKHTYKRHPREKFVSESLRSPFVERSVVLGSKLTKEETVLSRYMFDPRNDPHTLVFMTQSETEFYKVIFESLFPGIYVHIGVLESWMHILNADEKHRGPGSPLRLFLTPNIIPLPMLEKGIPDKARMEVFQSSIDVLLKNYNINNINKVDLIFIPIIKSEHVFLFVFDLKNPSVAIIDNMETANQSGDRYSHIPYIMDHPSALKISNQTPQSIELPWKTTKNGVDCGIFCMRHMKTYMGGGPKKWNSRLLNESEGQNKQLNQLRFKYLCKILMSNVNFLKEDILALSRKHDEMDEKKKNGQKPLQI